MVEDVIAAMQPYADQITIDFKTYLVVCEFACTGSRVPVIAALARASTLAEWYKNPSLAIRPM